MTLQRCGWVSEDADYLAYHDTEWGIPSFERQHLFEMLCLEGQQAGLSWITVLKKRPAYRKFFHQFVPESIALMDEHDVETLMQSPELIRNRLKFRSIIKNARALLLMEAKGETFVDFVWKFVDHRPLQYAYLDYRQAPVTSPQAIELSSALKRRGFSFIGPVICHAYMQACGLIIDHQVNCFRYTGIATS